MTFPASAGHSIGLASFSCSCLLLFLPLFSRGGLFPRESAFFGAAFSLGACIPWLRSPLFAGRLPGRELLMAETPTPSSVAEGWAGTNGGVGWRPRFKKGLKG